MEAYRPENLRQLRQLTACLPRHVEFVAGGTDFIIQMQHRAEEPEQLIYLGNVAEMREIREQEGGLFVGAGCTMTELSSHSMITGAYGALAEAAGAVGSVQVRNRGTIGGNIAHASAAADLSAPLMCLSAEALILRDGQIVRVPVTELIVGNEKTLLGERDVILGFLLPPDVKCMESHYYKMGFRNEVSISRFGIAMAVEWNGKIAKKAYVSVGAIGPKAVRMPEIERLICKKALADSTVRNSVAKEAGRLLGDYIRATSKRKYKMWAAVSVMEDAFGLFHPQER